MLNMGAFHVILTNGSTALAHLRDILRLLMRHFEHSLPAHLQNKNEIKTVLTNPFTENFFVEYLPFVFFERNLPSQMRSCGKHSVGASKTDWSTDAWYFVNMIQTISWRRPWKWYLHTVFGGNVCFGLSNSPETLSNALNVNSHWFGCRVYICEFAFTYITWCHEHNEHRRTKRKDGDEESVRQFYDEYLMTYFNL